MEFGFKMKVLSGSLCNAPYPYLLSINHLQNQDEHFIAAFPPALIQVPQLSILCHYFAILSCKQNEHTHIKGIAHKQNEKNQVSPYLSIL